MNEHLQQTIEFLRQHVLQNIELIKVNEAHIKEVLNWPITPERTKELNESYTFSKKLLTENNEFINLQVSLMNFLNKYKKVFDINEIVNVDVANSEKSNLRLTRDDFFKLTVQNDIEYNPSHPFYHDVDFYNDLLKFFQENENYEKCSELINKKR
jgi:hypothetical protein